VRRRAVVVGFEAAHDDDVDGDVDEHGGKHGDEDPEIMEPEAERGIFLVDPALYYVSYESF
jgi:hypothetical protein